jgi:hypothetical protein
MSFRRSGDLARGSDVLGALRLLMLIRIMIACWGKGDKEKIGMLSAKWSFLTGFGMIVDEPKSCQNNSLI